LFWISNVLLSLAHSNSILLSSTSKALRFQQTHYSRCQTQPESWQVGVHGIWPPLYGSVDPPKQGKAGNLNEMRISRKEV
jgi:hypothetical protein